VVVVVGAVVVVVGAVVVVVGAVVVVVGVQQLTDDVVVHEFVVIGWDVVVHQIHVVVVTPLWRG
jgi:hypothetical protein